MGRLLGSIGALVLYVCLGAVLGLAGVYGYLTKQGFLTPAKLAEMKAVMLDFQPESIKAAERAKATVPVPTLDEVARAKAQLQRDLELREQTLRSRAEQLRSERAQFIEEMKSFDRRKEQFEAELTKLRDDTISEGQTNARQILETIKPKQAKDQLLRMIEADAQDAAVTTLALMSPARRAKVIAEFKSPDDNRKLADILRRIREAEPEAGVIDKTVTGGP